MKDKYGGNFCWRNFHWNSAERLRKSLMLPVIININLAFNYLLFFNPSIWKESTIHFLFFSTTLAILFYSFNLERYIDSFNHIIKKSLLHSLTYLTIYLIKKIHRLRSTFEKIRFESKTNPFSSLFKTSILDLRGEFYTPERNISQRHPSFPRSVKFNAIERSSSSPRLAYFNARCFLSARTYARPKSGDGGRRGAPCKRRPVDIDAGTHPPLKLLASPWSMPDRRPDSSGRPAGRNSFDRWRGRPYPATRE